MLLLFWVLALYFSEKSTTMPTFTPYKQPKVGPTLITSPQLQCLICPHVTIKTVRYILVSTTAHELSFKYSADETGHELCAVCKQVTQRNANTGPGVSTSQSITMDSHRISLRGIHRVTNERCTRTARRQQLPVPVCQATTYCTLQCCSGPGLTAQIIFGPGPDSTDNVRVRAWFNW
jgi:hypothetical protein